MTSGGVDPPQPIRPPDVAHTPSPPPIEARPSSSHVNACGPSLVPASTPSPSSIDACGPSPIPTSTPSPSSPMGNMPIDEAVVNLAMEDPSLNNCPMVVAKAVTLSIRQQFGQPWPTWGAIPKEHQKLFFSVLRKLVWRPEEENEIKKDFNSKASHRLFEMFRDDRNENKRPYWIGDHVWNDLLSHWNAPVYRCKCAQAKNIGHLKRVGVCTQSKELGRSVYVDEDTGQFVDDRSKRTHEEFEARLSQVRSDVALSVDPAEEQRLRSRCWVAVAGPKYKGPLYGTGDLAHTYKCKNDSFMQHMQGSSSRAEDAVETNRLREELCQSKKEMRVFQLVVLQFLPLEAPNIIHQQQQPHQQHQDQQQDQADDQQIDDQQADDQQRHSPNDYFYY
ncbi:hypothetical protein HKD37_19G053054 [Glycine soja]